MNNFKNPKDYAELMKPPITEEEMKKLRLESPIGDCHNLIKMRCIDAIENVEERPFHCTDFARRKMVFTI